MADRAAPTPVASNVTDGGVHLAKVRVVTDRLPQPAHPDTDARPPLPRPPDAARHDGGATTLRSDARDNRYRILDAARAVFATEGLDVPMREVARRAGVGPATLYRRFPTKELLITEAFAEQMHTCRAIVDEGLADPDPWHGFCLVLEKICVLHAGDRGFTDAFIATYPKALDFAAERSHTVTSMHTLAARAKDTGRLRADFVLDDLILMVMANRGIRGTSTAARIAASRRFAALAIEAFRAAPGHPPLPPVGRLAFGTGP